jgi:hypothetical protein
MEQVDDIGEQPQKESEQLHGKKKEQVPGKWKQVEKTQHIGRGKYRYRKKKGETTEIGEEETGRGKELEKEGARKIRIGRGKTKGDNENLKPEKKNR